MPRDARAYFADIVESCDAITVAVRGLDLAGYEGTRLVRSLDMEWLRGLDKMEKNRSVVVYCEKIWVHRDDLARFEQDTKRTVRPMIVPFNLK